MSETPSAQSNTDWTIGRLLDWTRQHFQQRDIDEPRLCAELLLARALDCQKIVLYTRLEQTPSNQQRACFRNLVKAAAEHQPIAYLIGHKEFYSLDFAVTPDVLIPRPETELLVELALAFFAAASRDRLDLLDVGTGSGCLAITIAKRNPTVRAVATDVSEAALKVARQNAEKHQVADRLTFVRADMLDLPSDVTPDGRFDLIVSNPPYVPEQDRSSLPANVRDHEPDVALFGGSDGLDAYRAIAAGAHNRLRPGGVLLLEVGHDQAEQVESLFADASPLQIDGRHKDLAGIERVVQLTLPA